ncbi:MAG: phosphoribosylformylglycinamidine cyclo-ligase [archaeon]
MASYRDSGVDIDAGNESVKLMKDSVRSTFNKNVLTDLGAFGGAYSIASLSKMKHPILVSTMDGVGTKLKVAAMMNKWSSVGEDIVNHCSNDVLCLGAKPLFFLDYVAASKLEPQNLASVVSGMAKACREVDCVLIGGETAEMPGVYEKGEHDIAGCMVGVVEKSGMVDGSKIKKGDVMVALASDGLHTNGYSLARKVLFDEAGFSPNDFVKGLNNTVGAELLKVHRSYSVAVLALAQKIRVKGIAHITGGGLVENVPRVIPKGLKPVFDYSSIVVPPVFRLIQEKGSIGEKEMFRVFNMGVGLVLVVPRADALKSLEFLSLRGERAWVLGKIASG